MAGLRVDRFAEDRRCHSRVAAVIAEARKVRESRNIGRPVALGDAVDFVVRMAAAVGILALKVDPEEGTLPEVFAVGRHMELAVAEVDTSGAMTAAV